MAKEKVLFLGGKGLGIQVLDFLSRTDEIVGVVTNPEDARARWHTPVSEVKETKYPFWEENINLIKGQIANLNPTFMVCHGYDIILKQEILDLVPEGHAINLHTGLIDQYRGRYPTVYPIIDGKDEAGVTIHSMVSNVDAGAVYGQAKVKVDKMDTAETLYYKCLGAGLSMFEAIWDDIKSGDLKPYLLDTSKARIITKRDFPSLEIDLSWDREKIDRMVRATTFGPFPKPYFTVNNKKFEIEYKGGRI